MAFFDKIMSIVSSVQTAREEIAARLGESETDNSDFYTTGVNLCLRDIERSYPDSPHLRTSADRTLSSGTRHYAAASDFEKMNFITLPAADIRLSYLTPQEFDAFQPSASESGNPAIYTIRGQGPNAQIEYYPSPGSSVTVHQDYQRRITTVSTGSASMDLPPKYFELPVLYGEWRGLRRQGRFADAAAVKQEYEVMKQQMITELEEQTTEPKKIRSEREFIIANRKYRDPITNIFWGEAQ